MQVLVLISVFLYTEADAQLGYFFI